ncbi:putative orfan [Tupanvirus soda lake]|uniref:Orfan n=2 Tax=Tupanvirus TaxID=2094720 RepID=A0AC62AD61_9VIRU|nr:putative orfan [Tupanvirus soda lake]QKU35699.1 putative orfan [Tupanvirus soda lake]
MFKIMNYALGYNEIVCPCCYKKFYLEKKRYREGLICCSFGCMIEMQKKNNKK